MGDFPSSVLSKAKPKGSGRNSCPPPWAKGSCWMLFCSVIFTVIEFGAQKMDIQDLADQERFCWGSWGEWMAGHSLWYLFWGNSSSSQQLREGKEGKCCGNVCGVCLSFFWFLVCQTSDLHTYLNEIVSCEVTACTNLILPSWLEEPPSQCFEFRLTADSSRDRRGQQETGQGNWSCLCAAARTQFVSFLSVLFLLQAPLACVPLGAGVYDQLHCSGTGGKVWIFCMSTYFHGTVPLARMLSLFQQYYVFPPLSSLQCFI